MIAGHASPIEFLEQSCAAVATIQPVRPSWGWGLQSLLPRLWLWLAEWIDPVHDTGADDGVSKKMLGIGGVLPAVSQPHLIRLGISIPQNSYCSPEQKVNWPMYHTARSSHDAKSS